MSGRVAEEVHSGATSVVSDDDLYRLAEISYFLADKPGDIDAFVELITERAAALVRAEWTWIERVACELESKRRLRGPEVRALRPSA